MSFNVFDFDMYALNGFVIGEPLSAGNAPKRLENKDFGFAVYVEDKSISGIFFCLNGGYQGYSKFEGGFSKNKKILEISNYSKPEDIVLMFGEPLEQWDDGSEINMQFLNMNKYRIEFSWGIRESEIKLDYIIVELD